MFCVSIIFIAHAKTFSFSQVLKSLFKTHVILFPEELVLTRDTLIFHNLRRFSLLGHN